MCLERVVAALAANAMADILADSNPASSVEHGVLAHESAFAIGYADAETGRDMPVCFAKHARLCEAWQMGNQQHFSDLAIFELVGV